MVDYAGYFGRLSQGWTTKAMNSGGGDGRAAPRRPIDAAVAATGRPDKQGGGTPLSAARIEDIIATGGES